MEPTARSVNLSPDKFRQDEKDDATQIQRQGAPSNPAIVNQTGDHEREYTDNDPVRLLSPKVRGVRIATRGSRAVNCYNAENREREHGHEQKPVLAEQLSQKRRHFAVRFLKLSVASSGSQRPLHPTCCTRKSLTALEQTLAHTHGARFLFAQPPESRENGFRYHINA